MDHHPTQLALDLNQLEGFKHDEFVEDQVRDFKILIAGRILSNDQLVDVGGGVGYFASKVRSDFGISVRIIDLDPESVNFCRNKGIRAEVDSAIDPVVSMQDTIVSLNMVLHHLVASNDNDTKCLQISALEAWRHSVRFIYVNEYIYESVHLLPVDTTALLIWKFTRNSKLSRLAAIISARIPSLRANTFGVGVRFRSVADWYSLFDRAGYRVVHHLAGTADRIPVARRLLLLGLARRDSFLLAPK